MNNVRLPAHYPDILRHSQDIGFDMNSDVLTGSLLRTLAAAKPGGALLELGTGCGLGTSWLLDGMDQTSSLVSVDTDPATQASTRISTGLSLWWHPAGSISSTTCCRSRTGPKVTARRPPH